MSVVGQKKKLELPDLRYVFLLFLMISCLGFIVESVYCFAIGKGFHDRGFLVMPICPIYGVCVCIIWALFSVPDRIRLINRPLFEEPTARQKYKKYFTYFLFAALFPTLLELFTGFMLDHFFGVILWEYYDYPLNFHGYICPEISISWGILITLFMKFAFDRIYRLAQKVPSRLAGILTVIFAVLLAADFCFNLLYIILTGSNLVLY